MRESDAFIGGEKLAVDERITGDKFYDTIKEIGGIRRMYRLAETRWFDIYEQGQNLSIKLANNFRKAHTGILNSYMLWVLMSLSILILLLLLI